jgi:diguanylate cyclase (GGDEF)-like protein
LADIFEIYVDLASQSTNAVTKDMLRSLIFKQFKKYGDFDKQVRDTAQTVSDIKENTGNVITAIEEDNKENIKIAFDKLKACDTRMQELENGFLVDETTSLFNRQYLFSKLLSDELKFKDDGVLFLLWVDDIEGHEDKYGPIVIKSIIKKFAQSTKSALAQSNVALIRYEDNEFVILVDKASAHEVQNALKILHRTFEVKKFKISGAKTLSFNFSFKEAAFKANQIFGELYHSLLQAD